MADPRTSWPEVKKGLTELSASLASLPHGGISDRVREYVESNEFDVALDCLYAAVVENNIQLSPAQEGNFRDLAGLMGRDLKKSVWNKNGRELEKELTLLLNGLASSVEENIFLDVQDFIENREYGVALEWLYSAAVVRLKTPLSPFQAQKFTELADRMEIDLRDLEY